LHNPVKSAYLAGSGAPEGHYRVARYLMPAA